MTFFSPVLDEFVLSSVSFDNYDSCYVSCKECIMNAAGYLKGQCHDDIAGSGQFCAEVVT